MYLARFYILHTISSMIEYIIVLVVVLSTWHGLESFQKGNSTEKIPPPDCSIGKVCGTFSWLMINMEGSCPLWVVPSLNMWSWSVQESKQQARRYKPASCIPARFLLQFPHLEFLLWLSLVTGCDLRVAEMKQTLSFPSCFWSWSLHRSRDMLHKVFWLSGEHTHALLLGRCLGGVTGL